MASFSSTRNKIQAILSSFMHEKDDLAKERNAERDIAENPGPLSMLCQPRNKENFYDRVETFSPFTWPMKPLYLSPQHCALYGWENTDVDLLTCVSCKATLDGMVGTDWDTERYNSTCAKLRSSIVNGHSKFCPWKETPCPETFLSLSSRTSLEWKDCFENACRNLLLLEGNLPVLKREAFQELEIAEDVLSILSSFIMESDAIAHHQDIVDTVCVLALCGWNYTSDNSGILCCAACHREAGLWNFHSLRNVTLINNDGGQQINVGVEESARDKDEQDGSQGEMEEDIPEEVEDIHSNEGTQMDSTTTQEDMSCNIEIIRDVRSLKTRHLSGDIEPEDDSKQERSRTQEDMMDNEEYGTTVDTGDENRVTGDNVGGNMNESDKMFGDDKGTSETDPEETSEDERDGQVQNISQKEEGLECEEAQKIKESTQNEESTPNESNLKEMSSENQISGESVAFEPLILNNSATEILKTDIEGTPENSPEQVELQVKTESQPLEITSLEQNTLLSKENSQLPEQSSQILEQDTMLPEENGQSDTLSEEIPFLEFLPKEELMSEEEHLLNHEHLSGQEPLPEQGHIPQQEPLSEQGSISEQGPVSEQDALSEQELSRGEPLSEPKPGPEQRPLSEQAPPSEEESPSEEEPLSEEEPFLEQGTQKVPEISSGLDTCEQAMDRSHEPDKINHPPGVSGNEYTTDSDIQSDQGGCEPEPELSVEPSRLFGAGFFSPAHSRQDSLIVEIGEDSMSERMHSIQSDLLDRGETASPMDSCRSLSELSDGDVGEPSSKRFKTDDIDKIEFDVLAEHRNWCPWVTAVPSARKADENIQKSSGWQILLEHLLQSTSPGKHVVVKNTPPTQVWKSVRRLFHDCQTTIMRSTKSHILEGKV